jgi:hypothetical protein
MAHSRYMACKSRDIPVSYLHQLDLEKI